MRINQMLMYACTSASAVWIVLAILTLRPEPLLGSAAFGMLSYIYWDND